MPLRDAPTERPLPLARATASLEFDDLLLRRTSALDANGKVAPSTRLRELAREFAAAVDRENVHRQEVAGPPQDPIEYVDAVVLVGRTTVVVEAREFSATPGFYETSAGGDEVRVIHGRDLDAFLRTGDGVYADAIGLP